MDSHLHAVYSRLSISLLEPTEVERRAKKWKKVYAVHGQMWTFLGKLLEKAKKKTQIVISQEWPEF